MTSTRRKTNLYVLPNGKIPFNDWFDSLQDWRIQNYIIRGLNRLLLGNSGNSKRLSEDLYELKFHRSPGYRIYYGILEDDSIYILCAGTKHTQEKDIPTAQSYWEEFRRRGGA